MSRINLLPWRQERRARRQKEYLTILGLTGLAAALVVFAVIHYHNALIENQNQRNDLLKSEIAKLDQQLKEIEDLEKKREHLLNRKQVIEQLQADRSQMVHLFDQLVRTIPDGVRLTAIQQSGNTVTLEGLSQSNARVASYMRALEGSGWMGNPQVTIIEAKSGDKLLPYQFKLTVTLTKPKSDETDQVGAAGAAEGV